ncbi:MAG: acyclic terpene utilization AtuA family protein [Hyphomicrobiaceae bacterium]
MARRASDMLVLGCGAGFSSDRLEPAVALARSGRIDYLVFECVGERTLAFGHRDRRADPAAGYNRLIAPRLAATLPHCRTHGTRIVTNMGSANPQAAALKAREVARSVGAEGTRIAYVEGDDLTAAVTADWELPEIGTTVGGFGREVVGANVYLGVEHLLPAIASEADVVITGRCADPSLFLAPLVARFGWALDDWDRLARGTVAGHLLECGMQVTGGYFADPPFKSVPELARCGYPMGEVRADGGLVVTKLDSDGGCVTLQTVKEQLLYEVHDPAAYLTPDVTADFSSVTLADHGRDRIAVSGARGRPRPDTLKVTIGFDGGWQGEAGISYAGPGAIERARLARDILDERLRVVLALDGALRIDLVGIAALHATPEQGRRNVVTTEDVRVHTTFASDDRAAVEKVLWEVESLLCCGPAGGGGFRGQIVPRIVTQSAYVPRGSVQARTEVIVA